MKPDYYVFDKSGVLCPVFGGSKHGRYRIIDNKLVKVSSRARPPVHYGGSDDLGTQGVFCHADGKTYDSKSEYYRAVKSKGYEVVGNDTSFLTQELEYNISEKDLHNDIAESMDQLGY